jgi:hypothetical protein
MTYLIFLLGIFTGVFLGICVMGLCAAAGNADKWSEREEIPFYEPDLSGNILCQECEEWLTIEEARAKKCRCGAQWK